MKRCIFSLVFYVIKSLLAYFGKYVERKLAEKGYILDVSDGAHSDDAKMLEITRKAISLEKSMQEFIEERRSVMSK